MFMTSMTTWNKSGGNEHPCIVPDLGGSLQSFTIKFDIICEFFSDGPHKVEGLMFYSWLTEWFYQEKALNFFCSYLGNHIFCVPYSNINMSY